MFPNSSASIFTTVILLLPKHLHLMFRSVTRENGCIYTTTQFPWLHLISL